MDIQKNCGDTTVFADISGYRASDTPLTIIPPSISTTSYRPKIVIFSEQRHEVQLLKLTYTSI